MSIKKKLEILDKRTIKTLDADDESVLYIFDYRTEQGNTSQNTGLDTEMQPLNSDGARPIPNISNEQFFKWNNLYNLYKNKEVDVLQHPYMLNYINQILDNATKIYLGQFLLYIAFVIAWILPIPEFYRAIAVTCIGSIYILSVFSQYSAIEREKSDCPFFTVLISLSVLCLVAYFIIVLLAEITKNETLFTSCKIVECIAVGVMLLFFLFQLRISSSGIYIFMLIKVCKMVIKMIFIWSSILIALSIIFTIALKDTQIEPFNFTEPNIHPYTKITAMLIGELDAGDFITEENGFWISLLLLVFIIITSLILLPFLVAAAVGEVIELRSKAQRKMILSKVSFCLNYLSYPCVNKNIANTYNGLLIKTYTKKVFLDKIEEEKIENYFPNNGAYGWHELTVEEFGTLKEEVEKNATSREEERNKWRGKSSKMKKYLMKAYSIMKKYLIIIDLYKFVFKCNK